MRAAAVSVRAAAEAKVSGLRRWAALRRRATPAGYRKPKSSTRPAQNDVVKAINGDPFIGMFETPVTSSPLVRAAAG